MKYQDHEISYVFPMYLGQISLIRQSDQSVRFAYSDWSQFYLRCFYDTQELCNNAYMLIFGPLLKKKIANEVLCTVNRIRYVHMEYLKMYNFSKRFSVTYEIQSKENSIN